MKPYDLIIIGAGILGVSHAYHAAKNNLKVLIIEKDNFPVGSTVRNFGQIVPSGNAGKWFEYGRLATQIYKEIQAEYDISVRENGSIYVASDDQEMALINELQSHYKSMSYHSSLLSKRQTLELYPDLNADYAKGGLYFPSEISVEPNLLINKLLEFIQKKYNVDYLPNSAVIDCEQSADFVTIKIADNTKKIAKRVIICCGFHFNLLYPEAFKNSGLVASKLQMLQSNPTSKVSLKGNILTGLTIRRYEAFQEMPAYQNLTTLEHYVELKKWGIHLLFKQSTDGSIIIGDSHEYAPINEIDSLGFDSKFEINQLIINESKRILNFPKLEVAKVWTGVYSQHPDGIFEKSIDKGIEIITGIGGKGMTTSLGYAAENLVRLGILG